MPEWEDAIKEEGFGETRRIFFCLMAAWLNEVVVRAVALLSALTKEYNMHIIQC